MTGGGTGIGRAIAVVFAREGAKVAICGRREEPLAETTKSIRDEGGVAFYVRCDVSQADEVKDMVEATVERYGKINVLVNNAGVSSSGKTVLELTEEEWQHDFDITPRAPGFVPSMSFPK